MTKTARRRQTPEGAVPEDETMPILNEIEQHENVRQANAEAGRRLAERVVAVRVRTFSYAKSKQIKDDRIADILGVEDDDRLSTTKKLWDASDKRFSKMNGLVNEALRMVEVGTWRNPSIDGERLLYPGDPELRRDEIELAFDALEDEEQERLRQDDVAMKGFRSAALRELPLDQLRKVSPSDWLDVELQRIQRELNQECDRFNREDYQEILGENRKALGEQFDLSDYPTEIRLGFRYYFYSPAPPDSWNQTLGEEFTQQAARRFQEEMSAVIEHGKQRFFKTLCEASDYLVDALRGVNDDGRPRTFRDTTVTKIRDTLDGFREMLTPIGGSDHRLEQVFEGYTKLLGEIGSIGNLRCSGTAPSRIVQETLEFRNKIADQGKALVEAMESHMVLRPARRVTKKATL